LPEPLGPISACTSPAPTARSTPRTIWLSGCAVTLTFRPRTSRIGFVIDTPLIAPVCSRASCCEASRECVCCRAAPAAARLGELRYEVFAGVRAAGDRPHLAHGLAQQQLDRAAV